MSSHLGVGASSVRYSGRRAVLQLLSLLCCLACLAGDKLRRELVLNGVNFPNTMVILVDKSRSMEDYGKDAISVANAMWVAEQATDSGRVRFAAFDSDIRYWFPESGWIKLPDKERLKSARLWLRSLKPGGGTNLGRVVEQAIEETADVPAPQPLGLVLVTDEDPDGYTQGNIDHILEANSERKAVIGIIAVKPLERCDQLGEAVAKSSGGPFLRIVPAEPPTPTTLQGVR